MYITCLDMEGVLVPEIWIEFARESGIPELTRTTREDTVKPQSVSGSGSTVANGVMTVTLTEDVAVTNGKYTVKYDPAALTLESKTSPAAIKAFHVDETAGEITFAFAAAAVARVM